MRARVVHIPTMLAGELRQGAGWPRRMVAGTGVPGTIVGVLITNHVLAGAIIGSLSRNETTAFAAGLASHFALDALPHWGSVPRRTYLATAVVDGLVGASVMAAVAARTPKDRRRRVVAAMTGAALPDANKPAQLFFGRSPFPRWLDRVHGAIQVESPAKIGQEVLVASLLGAVAVGTLRPHVQVPRSTRASRLRLV